MNSLNHLLPNPHCTCAHPLLVLHVGAEQWFSNYACNRIAWRVCKNMFLIKVKVVGAIVFICDQFPGDAWCCWPEHPTLATGVEELPSSCPRLVSLAMFCILFPQSSLFLSWICNLPLKTKVKMSLLPPQCFLWLLPVSLNCLIHPLSHTRCMYFDWILVWKDMYKRHFGVN